MGWSCYIKKGYDAYNIGDYATAFKEWMPLTEQGNVQAQYNLEEMYRNGYGIPQDYKTVVKWYTLSAEQGIAEAQLNLDVMYYKGWVCL